jgi:hypothetical protein
MARRGHSRPIRLVVHSGYHGSGHGGYLLSIRSFLSKVTQREREPTLARAEEEFAQGRKADAAAQFRRLAEGGSEQAQLRLGQKAARRAAGFRRGRAVVSPRRRAGFAGDFAGRARREARPVFADLLGAAEYIATP